MGGWCAIVEEIRHDNRSGATALLRRAGDALRLAADEAAAGPVWRGRLVDAARLIGAARPALAAPLRLASEVLQATDRTRDADAARSAARQTVDRFLARVEDGAARIARQAAALVAPGDVVATISASSLVERTLRQAPRTGRIICLESRPALEGAALARRLAEAGLPATVVVDAAGPSLVAGARIVLLGGDTLSPAGLIHKVGTLGLALAARHHGVAVYALCGAEKWLPAPLRGALSDGGPPDEVLAERQVGLAAENPYFDQTPLSLLDGVVGPEGMFRPSELAGRLASIAVHGALADLLER